MTDIKLIVIINTSLESDVLTMGVMCRIMIQRPRENVHTAGGAVLGTVQYSIDEPTEYKDIKLCLIGKGECTWSESRQRHGRRGGTNRKYFKGTEVYVATYISILNKHPGLTAIILPGTYEYNFRFMLPDNIPPSFKNSTCTIAYQIKIKFKKQAFFSINKQFTADLTVYGSVEPAGPEGNVSFGLEKTLLRPFSKRTQMINLKADILNTIFSPGQNADISFTVTNITDVKLTSLKTELLCYTTYIANCGRRKETSKTIKESTVETPSVPADAVANLTSVLPIQAHLYSIQNCRIMKKEYKVKVTLRLPVPYINASVEVPIVIGEMRGNRDNEGAMFARDAPGTSVETVEVEGSAYGPPSYWEVMYEDFDEKEYKVND